MKKLELLTRRVEAIERNNPPKDTISDIIKKMNQDLISSLLQIMKDSAENQDIQDSFNKLTEKQKAAVKNLFERHDVDSVLTRFYMGDLAPKLEKILKSLRTPQG